MSYSSDRSASPEARLQLEEQRVRKASKITVGVVVVASVVTAGWVVMGKRQAVGPGFLTADVDRGTVIQSVATTGTLSAITTVKVGSQVSGIIATLHADFNGRVTKDEILATLDPTPFEAQVNQSKAQLERTKVAALDAQIKLKRQRSLLDAGLTSQDQVDTAQAAYDQANAQVSELQAALDRAQTNLTYSIIRSPIDGVVVSRDYDVGQTVAASFQAPTLFTIAEDLKSMQLACDVDEADIGQVKVGQPVKFTVDTFPERDFDGKVSQIRLSPKTSSNVVTYPVIVEVDNQDLTLLPGMTADVRIQVARAENALRVPASATRFRPELLGLTQGAAQVARSDHGAERSAGGGAQPGGQAAAQMAGKTDRGPKTARVFLAPAKPGDPLRPVTFTSGLSDGQFFEVKDSDLAPGTKIVVGLATSQAQDAGGLVNMMGPRRR
jgi:HlyD family secretion protein